MIKKIEIRVTSGKWALEFSEREGLKRFIPVLQDSTILKELSMSGFQFSNLGHLSNMVHLSTLNLKSNHLYNGKYSRSAILETRWQSKFFCSLLRRLAQNFSEGTDSMELQILQPISNLVQLTALDLSDNKLRNIHALVTLTNLTRLDLYNNNISCNSDSASTINNSSLEPLREHRKLTELNLGKNRIMDLSPLSALVKLTTLNLSRQLGLSRLTDITPLSQLTSITTLTLRKNRVVDITVLSNLIQLTDLDLSNNKIVSLDALENLHQLVTFDGSRNKIKYIDALHSLTQLQVRSKFEKLKCSKLCHYDSCNYHVQKLKNENVVNCVTILVVVIVKIEKLKCSKLCSL